MTPEAVHHPTLHTDPSADDKTFAGHLMLRVATGLWDRDELRAIVDDQLGDWEAVYEQPAPSQVDAHALLDRVIAVHDSVVPRRSAGMTAFLAAMAHLHLAGVASSLGEGWDTREAARAAHQQMQAREGDGTPAVGYLYAHLQDIERVVLDGVLYLGFSGPSGVLDDEAAAVGHAIVEELRAQELSVTWDGDPRSRIRIEPLLWAMRHNPD